MPVLMTCPQCKGFFTSVTQTCPHCRKRFLHCPECGSLSVRSAELPNEHICEECGHLFTAAK